MGSAYLIHLKLCTVLLRLYYSHEPGPVRFFSVPLVPSYWPLK